MQIAADNRGAGTAAQSAPHHGGTVEVIVLGAFAAELALLIGDRGAVAAILLASVAAACWWLGYGKTDTTADPVALGNALGIMTGLAIGFPQLLLPLAIALPTVAFTGSRRLLQQGARRGLGTLALTTLICAAGATWLALNLHLLPR